MKKAAKLMMCVITAAATSVFAGCSSCASSDSGAVYVTSIAQSGSDGLSDYYTIYYSDGSTSVFTVTNGRDGSDGDDGNDGADGADGKSVTVADLYEAYVEEYGEISYSDFLALYFSEMELSADNSYTVAQCLLSAAKIYTEFIETTTVSAGPNRVSYSDTALYTGSAVIWSVDGEEDGYTYLVTNYHVVFDSSADTTKNGGVQTARKIVCYLYGSEETPSESDEKDSDGYTAYDYGGYGVECEYVGGSIGSDIAVVRTKTSSLTAINPDIRTVELADEYHVGETAITIGNAEGYGLSATQGIVSVDNEYITLSFDGTSRIYRSIRIDTALYSGNSGGGLFNAQGKLIGIANAGSTSDENINFAVPVGIVRGAVENILCYFLGGDGSAASLNRITLGVTVEPQNSRYVYDSGTGYGNIVEDVAVSAVTDGSIAAALGLEAGDVLQKIIVNGSTEVTISRYFDLFDLILTIREGDTLQAVCLRGGGSVESETYTVLSSDLQEEGNNVLYSY